MTLYLLKRFSIAVAIILAMVTLMFIQVKLTGGIRLLDEYATQAQYDAWVEKFGLDRPAIVQYGRWIANAAKGDFGVSRLGVSAFDEAVSKIPGTLKLVFGGFVASIIFTALTMAFAVSRRCPKLDYAGRILSRIGPAFPVFLVGVILFQIFGRQIFTNLPAEIGRYILPSATLGIFMAYGMVRLLGTAANDVTNARSEGASTGDVSSISIGFWTKAIKAALLNLLGSSRGFLFAVLTAVIVTEVIFHVPGLVRLAGATRQHDLPVHHTAIFCLTVAYAATLFALDIVRAFVDTRVRTTASTSESAQFGAAVVGGLGPRASHTAKSWPVFGRWPMIPSAILVVVVFLAIFGPFIAPHDLVLQPNELAGAPPAWLGGDSWSNVLGVDPYGRDMLRLISYGARYSLTVAAGVLGISATAGFIAVYVSSRFGGLADSALTWLIGFTSAFPILIVGYLSSILVFHFPSFISGPIDVNIVLLVIMALLSMMVWSKFVERLRSEILRSRLELQLSDLAASGTNKRQMLSAIIHHIRPRLPKIILVTAALNVGTVILMESAFSFLGMTISINSNQFEYGGWGWLARHGPWLWWMALFPGIAIVLTVLSFNFIGEWLRERLDPQPSHREDDVADAAA